MNAKNKRPNIVFIITDQQRFDTIRSLGFEYMRTPNLDKLVETGVGFSNCFVTAPTCAPARASLFTGRYAHNTGIYKNADYWQRSWVEDFAAAGYHCVNVGKMHTYPFETPLGFHERFVVENKDRYLEGRYFFDRWDMAMRARGLVKQQREYYRTLPDYRERLGAFEWTQPEDLHSDFFVGNLASWWIKNKPDTQPFFLQVGFPGPHPPYDPVPRYINHYKDHELPLPRVTQKEQDGLPPAQHELIEHNCRIDHDSIVWKENPTPEQLQRLWRYYLANVTMIDEKVGEIVAALKEKEYLNNTIIVFTSDHGDCLGEHGHIQKWVMYDSIVRIPMILWGPGFFGGPKMVDSLCQQFDIIPVLMEAAGVKIPESWDAKSIQPLIDGGGRKEFREYVFAEQGGVDPKNPGGGFLTGTKLMTMIRGKDYKLVYYLDTKDQGELYDLQKDPGETDNLWNRPEYREKKNELIRILLDWRMESGLRNAETAGMWH